MRFVTNTDNTPLEVTSATPTGHPSDPTRIDRAMHATFALPDSATGSMTADFALPGRGPLGLVPRLLPQFTLGVALEGGRVELWNYAGPHVYHWIKVRPARAAARIRLFPGLQPLQAVVIFTTLKESRGIRRARWHGMMLFQLGRSPRARIPGALGSKGSHADVAALRLTLPLCSYVHQIGAEVRA